MAEFVETEEEAAEGRAEYQRTQAIERLARGMEPNPVVWSDRTEGLVLGQIWDRTARQMTSRRYAENLINNGVVRVEDVQ